MAEDQVKRPALPIFQTEPDPDFWEKHGDQYNTPDTWQVMKDSAQSAWSDSFLGTIETLTSKALIDGIDGQKTLTVPELIEKYKELNLDWRRPEKFAVAEYIATEERKRRAIAERESLAYGGALESTGAVASGFAGAIVGNAPILFGASAAIRSATFLPSAIRGASIASSLARGAVEGVVEETAMQPLRYARDNALQRDFDITNSLANLGQSVIGGAIFEALPTALEAGFKKGYSAARRYFNDDNVKLSAFDNSVASVETGVRPNSSAILKQAAVERSGIARDDVVDISGRKNYNFVGKLDDTPTTGMFHYGSKSNALDISNSGYDTYKNSTTDFGTTLTGTDNPVRANGYAANSFNDAPGNIHSFSIDSFNLINADIPMNKRISAAVTKAVKSLLKDGNEEEIEGILQAMEAGDLTPREIYETLSGSQMDEVNKVLSKEGYDGIHFTDEIEGSKANGVAIFPDSVGKISKGDNFLSDKGAIPKVEDNFAAEAIGNGSKPEHELLHSADSDEIVETLSARAINEDPLDQTVVDKQLKDSIENIKDLDAEGMLEPDDKALFDFINGKAVESPEVKSINDQIALGEGVIKGMFKCLRDS